MTSHVCSPPEAHSTGSLPLVRVLQWLLPYVTPLVPVALQVVFGIGPVDAAASF